MALILASTLSTFQPFFFWVAFCALNSRSLALQMALRSDELRSRRSLAGYGP